MPCRAVPCLPCLETLHPGTRTTELFRLPSWFYCSGRHGGQVQRSAAIPARDISNSEGILIEDKTDLYYTTTPRLVTAGDVLPRTHLHVIYDASVVRYQLRPTPTVSITTRSLVRARPATRSCGSPRFTPPQNNDIKRSTIGSLPILRLMIEFYKKNTMVETDVLVPMQMQRLILKAVYIPQIN